MARKSRREPRKQAEPSLKDRTYSVGVYFRVSVENDSSIINQEQIVQDFLNQHKELVLNRLYIDDGKSSFFGSRPELCFVD